MTGTRVPNSVHEAESWVIGQIAPDFKLLDVWALPVYGARDDFGRLLEMMASYDPARSTSFAVRLLFSVRYLLGALFGWDDPEKKRSIPGSQEMTLAERLPEHLRGSAAAQQIAETMQRSAGGFKPLYRTEEEWAAEISNETVHGVLHLGWLPQENGVYRAQMAVYVKPRGRLGHIYMMMIQPFRHLIVYPALIREIESAWKAHRANSGPRSPAG